MRPLNRAFITSALLLGLAGCSQGGHSDDCGDNPQPPAATLTEVDGSPYSSGTYEIRVQRPSQTSKTVALLYTVQRTDDPWCGGSYLGPLTPRYQTLPAGLTATFTPTTLPATTRGTLQSLSATLTFGSSLPDGRYPLTLVSPEVMWPYRAPTITLVLTTAP